MLRKYSFKGPVVLYLGDDDFEFVREEILDWELLEAGRDSVSKDRVSLYDKQIIILRGDATKPFWVMPEGRPL
jgi:hypothetical protein